MADDSPEPERDSSLLATRMATVPRRLRKAPDLSPVETMSPAKIASLGRTGRWFTRTVPLIPEMEPATSGRVNLPAPKPLAVRIKVIPTSIPKHRRVFIFNLCPLDQISGFLLALGSFFRLPMVQWPKYLILSAPSTSRSCCEQSGRLFPARCKFPSRSD